MKITNLKKAIGEYQRANSEGYYSPRYGRLMFDKSDGLVWCDQFYSLGHNEWKEYHSDSIVDLGRIIVQNEEAVNMKSAKKYIELICKED